jgi:hypothetical protein
MITAARIIGKKFQTPVRTYTHPDKQRTITVVSTCHYGEAGYFERLYDRITAIALDGALIYSEGSDKVEGVPGELTKAEQDAVEARRRIGQLTTALVAGMGWTGQPAPPTGLWQFRDMSTIEIIRAVGPEVMARQLGGQAALLQRAQRSRRAGWLALLLILTGLRQMTSGKVKVLPKGHPGKVLVEERNRVAMADAHATGADLVLVWGAAHAVGFHEDLTAHGYHCEAEEWYSVLSMPSTASLVVRMLLGRRMPAAKK